MHLVHVHKYSLSPIFFYLKVVVTPWASDKHNMGMVFDRRMWRKLHSCSTQFCSFDDYNWDWSLRHVSQECLDTKLKVIMVKAPRVFHVGEW